MAQVIDNLILFNAALTQSDFEAFLADAIPNGVHHIDDTHITASSTSKLKSWRNNGVEKAALYGDGHLELQAGISLNKAISLPVRLVSANYAITFDDYVIICTVDTFTVTLPSATTRVGVIFIIKSRSSGTITVAASGVETIDGSSDIDLIQDESIMIQSDGANWVIL